MLIDTSGWLCLFDENDHRHDAASMIYHSSRHKITHSYVIAEFVPLCEKRRLPRKKSLDFLSELLNDTKVTTIWVDEMTSLEAFSLLQQRLDKSWSICDAVSFIIMRDYALVEALTTDHHFEQAGFVKLLES